MACVKAVAVVVAMVTPILAGCLATGSNSITYIDEPPPALANPSDLDDAALMRIARTAEDSGDLIDAASVYRRLAERQPASPGPRIELGRYLLRQGDAKSAEAAFQEASVLAPADVDAQLGIAQAQLAQGLHEQALATYRTIIERHQGELRALNGAGIALDSLGRHSEAQMLYRQGLVLAPRDLTLRNNLGLSLAYEGKKKDALAVLEELAADPNASTKHRETLDRVRSMKPRRTRSSPGIETSSQVTASAVTV